MKMQNNMKIYTNNSQLVNSQIKSQIKRCDFKFTILNIICYNNFKG